MLVSGEMGDEEGKYVVWFGEGLGGVLERCGAQDVVVL